MVSKAALERCLIRICIRPLDKSQRFVYLLYRQWLTVESRFSRWVLMLQNQRCLGFYTEPYKHCYTVHTNIQKEYKTMDQYIGKLKKLRAPLIILLSFWAIAIVLWKTTGNIFFLFNFGYIGTAIGVGIGLG